MRCSSCLNRWLGKLTLAPAKWYCRKDTKDNATVIGEGRDEDLKKAKGCRNYKK